MNIWEVNNMGQYKPLCNKLAYVDTAFLLYILSM